MTATDRRSGGFVSARIGISGHLAGYIAGYISDRLTNHAANAINVVIPNGRRT